MKKHWMYVLMFAGAAVVGGVAGSLAHTAVAEQLSFDRVTAREFVLEDPNGRRVGEFVADDLGVHLELFGEGTERVVIAISKGLATVSLNDLGKPKAFMTYRSSDGNASMIVCGKSMRMNNVAMMVSDGDHPFIAITRDGETITGGE